MPVTPVTLAATLTPALLSTGMLGTAMPRFSMGVSTGVSTWIRAVTVTTIDAGTLGVGSGQLPLVVPQPLLLANILAAMASMGLLGIMAPLKALGLSTGLSAGLLLGLIKTIHPTIGVGTGMAKLSSTPAAPFIISGLAQVGMVGAGTVQIGTAIGMGLNQTLLPLVFPVPIVGTGSTVTGGGVGYGVVL